jgi:hypothetical protein
MPRNSPKETALPVAENGPLQWLILLGVAWSLVEAIRLVWMHAA